MRVRFLIASALLATVPLVACSTARADDDAVARGKYLTAAGDCTACHTTPGGAPFAGGLPIHTPFGAGVPPNITPDKETGIGGWTDKQFLGAIRHGLGAHGEHLYAAMPYNDYVKVTDQDVLDIKAYLDTVPAVHRKVIANQLPFPFNIRLSLLAWNALYFDDTPFKPDPAQNAEWNRGAYLVQGLGHCAACHTPKTLLGGDKSGAYLQGAEVENWWAPALVGDTRSGLGNWSADEIAAYLKTGSNRHAVAAGPMAEAVHDETQFMSDADLHAIGVYLKSLPAPARKTNAADPPVPPMRGAQVFAVNCAACHAADGTGIPGMVPALRSDPAILADDPADLLHVVLKGGKGAATESNPTAAGMPSFAWKLTDADIAAVASWLRASWGHDAPAVTERSVARQRSALGAPAALPRDSGTATGG